MDVEGNYFYKSFSLTFFFFLLKLLSIAIVHKKKYQSDEYVLKSVKNNNFQGFFLPQSTGVKIMSLPQFFSSSHSGLYIKSYLVWISMRLYLSPSQIRCSISASETSTLAANLLFPFWEVFTS